MCGIVGVLSLDSTVPPRPLAGSLTSLSHRGPDGSGEWSDEVCWLGHRRLAIIDLSEAGCQPMSSPDEQVWVTYNGEIYNFRELRAELGREGHTFRSGTDTEVLVHAYERWGESMVDRLRGMFAFGLWDRRRRRLLLVRDRVGQKPLFWATRGGRLLFASELGALLGDPDMSRDPDLSAIDEYLTWGYIPAPRTGYAGIQKLPPGHMMSVQLGGSTPSVEVRRYWRLDYGPKLDLPLQTASERLRELMTEAVRLRLISDVPLGAFLSGGIDSSIVVGLMAQLSPDPVRTFSIGFEETEFDELPHARRVADQWGTEHTELVVRPDAVELLPTLVRHYGEPYADSSAIPTFYVSKLTRNHVTVALNGDGGDESFAGYERYWGNALAEHLRVLPGFNMVSRVGRVIPTSVLPRSLPGRARRFLVAAAELMPTRYARWSSYFDAEARAHLMKPEYTHLIERQAEAWMADLFDDTVGLGPVDRAMSADVRSYLPFDLLVKVDIATMAHSLEARSPFLDHEVMEFAARLPETFKMRGRRGKWILRRTFEDLLPRENAERRKMGFGVPVGSWLRGPLRDLLHDTVLSPRALIAQYLRPESIRAVVNAHLSGRSDYTSRVWALLMLELWHRDMAPATPSDWKTSERSDC